PDPTPEPTPTPKPTPQIDKITLSCAGDCTIGTDPKFNYSTSLNAMVTRVGDMGYFFKNMQKYFDNDDMTIVNFEGTLTNRTTPAQKTFTFRGPPSYVKILKKGNIESVGFANNHCRDFLEGSYYDTMATLKKAGIKYSSYYRTSIYKVEKKKTGNKYKIGMISVCGLDSYSGSLAQIKSGTERLKKKNCDLIIVSMHDGTERMYSPRDSQKGIARYAIDHGADIVLGHHPHVLQGVEKYKGSYIIYSLGNFCFGGNSNPSDKDTMVARPTFVFKNGKLKKGQTILRLIPCCLSSTTAYNNYQPTPKTGSERGRVLAKINNMCEPLGTTLKDDQGKLTTIVRKK
ncbi:MAG: CapA family protein, partial [Eubacterium sp.]|nr:CapA family protein [Eubacterium sp.]